GHFQVLGLPLSHGRLLDARDRVDSLPVAIINEALAREYFGAENPIGQRLRVGGPVEPPRSPWLTIVGVIGTEQRSSVFQEMAWIGGAVLFPPLSQSPPSTPGLLPRRPAPDPAHPPPP